MTHPTQVSTPRIHKTIRLSLAPLGASLALAAFLTGCAGGATPEPLPSGFPTSVPLVSERVVAADAMGAGWTAIVKVSGEDEQKASLEQMTDEGFAVIGESGSDAADKTYSLANEKYSVRLAFGQNDDGYTVGYTIAQRIN